MAFNINVDEYSVLSIGGGYDFVAEDILNQTSFVFQMAGNTTAYPSVINITYVNLLVII